MNWLNSMLADGQNGSVSSKRVITLSAFLICAFAMIADIFGHTVTPALFESIDRKSTRLNSSHSQQSRMPSSA